MLKLTSGLLAAAALLAFPLPARADGKVAAPSAPRPAAELAALDFLHGSFSCSGTWHSEAGGSVPKQSKLTSHWVVDKFFLAFDYEEAATAAQPKKISATGYWGWDVSRKKYVHSAINNEGLTITLYADAGGDALSFKGEGDAGAGMAGAAMHPMKITFKKAAKGFTITNEVERDGKPVTVSEETCTK